MSIERRSTAELRAAGTPTSPRLHGYAAVYDSESQDLGGFTEVIRAGAFKRTLQDNASDPLALVHHMPHLVLGRRSAGTLRLNEDAKGLAFEIDVPNTQTGRDILTSVQRGDIRGASFAFTVPKDGDSWNVRGGNVLRELRDVDLFEISLTAAPAYQDTQVAQRAFKNRHASSLHLIHARLYLETL